MKEKISIIVPVYNERENIALLVDSLRSVMDLTDESYEIIFVNDGSTDGSETLLDAMPDIDARIRVIHFRRNFGQTAAMSAGFDHAVGDIMITLDADLQNDPGDIPAILAKLREGFDVVSCRRENRRDPWLTRKLPSMIANCLISWISKVRLHDYGCTLKGYRRDVMEHVRLYGEMHRFIPIYASWAGARVTEIAARHHPRKFGRSKYGLNRTFKVILDLITLIMLGNYSTKPMYFFGGAGMLACAGGVFFGAWTLFDKYFNLVKAHNNPLLLLAVFLFIIGIQFILMGLVAELLIRTWFESQGKTPYIIRNIREQKPHNGDYVPAEYAQDLLEHKQITKILLDAMPFACDLWDRNGNVFECTEENLRLLEIEDKSEYLNRFFDFSPKYQPDGSLSLEKSPYLLKKAFESGKRITTEWMLQTSKGTPVPAEVTLIRVPYKDDYAVAAYVRDLREHKKMMREIERRDNLLHTVNTAANVLLQSESGEFENALRRSMSMIGASVDVDRVCIWKNHVRDGCLYTLPIYEWLNNAEPQVRSAMNVEISYDRDIPGWEETLAQRKCINRNVRNMSLEELKGLSPLGLLSVCVVPVFVRDQFWGTVGFDDCHSIKSFSEDEVSVLRSGGLLITNALLRNEMTLSLKTAAARLENALNDARNANEAKSIFLARMSHEIRTPLNAVIGLSELTLETGGIHNEARTNLEKIYNSGTMLLNIVNDILDISKIEAGKLELIEVEYDIPSLINDTVSQSIVRIEDKPIEFVLNIDENLPEQLFGDDLRIKQIINNLLSNAIKYTKKGVVELCVRCEREDGTDAVWMTVSVRDTGIGIRPEAMSHLFKEYEKLDKMSNRAVEGIGLGLSIARMLVEHMDGEITAESEYGKGSVFTAKFRQKSVNDNVIGTELVNSLKELRYADSKRARNSQLVRIHLPYARVLVVDDNATNLDVAKGMMQAYGMQIDCMSSGQQAIEAVRSENVRYNAIFMDYMMPGMDGIEATRIIREEIGTEYARTVPIIAVTANAIIGNKGLFLNKGFQAFLVKPIEISRLDAIIRQWVRNKDQEIDDIPGLNISAGLMRFGGDEKIYRQVLRSYVTNTRLILESINEINAANLEDYIFTVHGIKASSRGIGADMAGAMAEALEKAAMTGDLAFLREHHPAFLAAAGDLMHAIEDMLEKTSVGKQKKSKPDMDVLSKIAAACKNYDIDGLDAAMADLETYEYESDDDLARWLRENVDRMNYEEIYTKLSIQNGAHKTDVFVEE